MPMAPDCRLLHISLMLDTWDNSIALLKIDTPFSATTGVVDKKATLNKVSKLPSLGSEGISIACQKANYQGLCNLPLR
ncbi:hypothetical protein X801_07295, partial [Opisthorchis viverrini]